ncbi:t-RNA-binding domain-containing protein [Endozoicomonas numazuensis]|uniref:T-RNA-binding domain-containing protein n=1 Tax=Endozoicomonas numazuensis TaxID=1137799 RepID=A0A081NHJ8_9GAMM|nr:t-RNA-binding domain-containing protein [Endozoicomonas numazuensis]KEQ17921.1 t-RNA-binding domain-containing protein [Endozoicomonas numazuensis]
MAKELKPIVSFENSLEKLDIRVGKIIEVELEEKTPKTTYKMIVDFGKFGVKTSYGRFTKTSADDIKNQLVLGVLNFEPRAMGSVVSEVLILGVQYPKADSGEATFITPMENAKLGSKVF